MRRRIDKVLSRITLPGAFFLAGVAVLPDVIIATFNVPAVGFGGTSVLIVVGVALDTLQQIESHLLMRHYEGFVKRGRIRGRSRMRHASGASRPAGSGQGHPGAPARG